MIYLIGVAMFNDELSQNQEELQNLYAYTIKDDVIFIEDATSGRQGYFCMGCKREMQAVKFKVQNRQSHFRHDPQAVKHTGKCTYSDETYRHKIAKEFLQMTKRIKVPSVYKFSPDGVGLAYKLRDSRFIEAHTVINELQFYEDDYGIVKWGKNVDDNKNFLIKPDVTFFNSLGEPILLIEIVVTHKPNADKLLKILRLGIDTISVTIPRDSPENIENTFSNINRTKWIYNYEQESAEYLQLSNSSAEGVLYFDEEQRKLFAESIKCTKAHINNLIRTIGRCLESEQYRGITENLESEILRVERNAKELRRDIDRKAETFEESMDKEERVEIERFGDARAAINSKIRSIEQRDRDLENRYIQKRGQLERDERVLGARVIEAKRILGRTGEEIDRRRETCKRDADVTAKNISKLSKDTEIESGNAKQNEKQLSADFERFKREEEEAIVGNEQHREQLQKKYTDIEGDLHKEFESKSREFDEAISSGTFGTVPELSERIQGFDDASGLIHDLIQNQIICKRNRAIREFLTTGMFKAWL